MEYIFIAEFHTTSQLGRAIDERIEKKTLKQQQQIARAHILAC